MSKLFSATAFLLSLILLSACCKPQSESYRSFYSYRDCLPKEECFQDSPYYIIFLVNARHLDYSSISSIMKTCAKHPSDGSKNGDVGHAWILLKSPNEVIEGGQSGETGFYQPRYFEGILENAERGASNPVCYLWSPQCDGFFQRGSGGHRPTFAAKVDLNQEQFEKIKAFVLSYDFREYQLNNHQCTTFVKEAADKIGLILDDQVDLQFPNQISIWGRPCCLWRDEEYQCFACGSPDKLEESLIALSREGRASNVTCWYIKNHRSCPKESFSEKVVFFPLRLMRWAQL